MADLRWSSAGLLLPELIESIGPGAHHCHALRKVVGIVVRSRYHVFLRVRELQFDVLVVESFHVLVGRGNRSPAVPSHLSPEAHLFESPEDGVGAHDAWVTLFGDWEQSAGRPLMAYNRLSKSRALP